MFGQIFGMSGDNIIYRAPSPAIIAIERDPANCTATLFYDSDGGTRIREDVDGGQTFTDTGTWSTLHPGETDGLNWWVNIQFSSSVNTYNSGDLLATWLRLDVNRSWTFLTGGGPTSPVIGNFTASLSDDGGLSTYDGPNNFSVSLEILTP